MTRQAHALRTIVSALSATLLAATAACGTSQSGTAEPSGSATPIATTTDDMRTALHDTSYGNDPLETIDPTPATHTIRNEADAEYEPGSYVLTVLCMGQGTLQLKWELGDTGEVSDAIACTPDIMTRHYGTQLDQPVTGSRIELTPQADTDATMAYRLDRITDTD